MLSEENEIAFALWTVETGNASRADWDREQNKDKFLRMARMAIRRIGELRGSHP